MNRMFAIVEREMRKFEAAGLDGVLVVMLTYGPAMRVARLLSESRLPICLANIQPEPNVTPQWDMADMTYNQGVHGAQDTANAMVRAGWCIAPRFSFSTSPRRGWIRYHGLLSGRC